MDLTGYWLADDGCQYYISQEADTVWWAGLDNQGTLQDGLQVSNVFFGQIPLLFHPPGTGIEDTIDGEWFDVPRASAMSSGKLSLRISLDTGEPVLVRISASGGFRATQWHKSPREIGASNLSWFDKPIHEADAEQLFQEAVKNSGNVLLDDLKPFRPVVVAYGWVRFDDPAKDFRSPYVSQSLSSSNKSLSSFFDDAGDSDRDANFDLSVDLTAWQAHLESNKLDWTARRDPRVIEGKLKWGREHQGQGESRLHCEMMMYGTSSTDSGNNRIYPGWADVNGNSILANGRPVNKNIGVGPSIFHYEIRPVKHVEWHFHHGRRLPVIKYVRERVKIFDPVEHYLTSIGGLELAGRGGVYVRVTGVLALDCGHSIFGEFNPCYDEDPESERDMSAQNQEIHPVLAVDIITATPRANLSGTWGAVNGDTIYLHQLDQRIMGLRMPPLGGGNGLTVLRGVRVGNEIRGEWRRVSPPFGTGELVFEFGGTIASTTAPSEGNWRKLYDATDNTPSIAINVIDYGQCDLRRAQQGVERGRISFTVSESNFAPSSRLRYSWLADGARVIGANEQTVEIADLPSAGTPVKVSVTVDDEDTQSSYSAIHEHIVSPPLRTDDRTWLELIGLIQNISRVSIPGPIPEVNLPTTIPHEIIERIRESRSGALAAIREQLLAAEHLVHRLAIEPHALEGAPAMRTVFNISDVACHAFVIGPGETKLTVEFRVHDDGPAHVAGVVVTTDLWAASHIAYAEFQSKGDGSEAWRAEFSAHGPPIAFECVVFCDDFGSDHDVPRVWETNAGQRYRVSVEDPSA